MARTALPGRLTWQLAAVAEVIPETAQTTSVSLEPPEWAGHRAGQHVDVRLTAPDGYQAQRSYSIASAPEDDRLLLTVERLEDGEVSPYLTDELRPGDELELRGPIGGYFVWPDGLDGPVQLIAGGSGVVPFRAMLRHRAAAASNVPVRLLYSARSLGEVIYREELERLGAQDGVKVDITLTRQWPDDWQGHRGRISDRLLAEVTWPVEERPAVFVCGPTGFVETASTELVKFGHPATRIKTERFGPTG